MGQHWMYSAHLDGMGYMIHAIYNTTHLKYIKIWGMPQNCHVNRKQGIVDHKILK